MNTVRDQRREDHGDQHPMEFKVWIAVEQLEVATDSYIDLDLPFASSAQFNNEEDALRFAGTLHDVAHALFPLLDE